MCYLSCKHVMTIELSATGNCGFKTMPVQREILEIPSDTNYSNTSFGSAPVVFWTK